MIVPIGKITEDKRIEAVIIYDTDKHEKKLISLKELYEVAKDKNNVCGVESYINAHGNVVAMRDKQYIWDNIPECNGKCIPEVKSDQEKFVLLGSCNSRLRKGYVLVNVLGQVKVLGHAEMKNEVQKSNVIGAKMRKNGRVVSYINNNFDSLELKKIGYELKDNKWIAIEKEDNKKEKEMGA